MNKIPGNFLTLPPALLAVAALTGFREIPPAKAETHPNILLIMVDQMQTPPEGYGPNEGAVQDLKEILGFRPLSQGNSYTRFFPGLMRLRQNAVVLKKHYTASAASVPSRSCIMTGQYPAVTGVDHTDGLFKSADDVPFLDSIGAPTLGDWFRAAGYKTHYFGKWHVSEAGPPDYLEPWGFSDWESSYPEPHGGTSSNLGVFRDVVFTENIVDFLNRAGTDSSGVPWFTVASIVNPHDISAWPINWQVPGGSGVVGWDGYPPPPSIPAMGDKSRFDTCWTMINGDSVQRIFQVDLNPDGFPQNNSFLSPTFTENLSAKPWCQRDYMLKWGLAWGATTDLPFIQWGLDIRSPHPFQLQGANDSAWSLSYIQFYHYCEYLADLQIRKILQALDSNHLTNNTIVVFLSDHGDLTTAHGGMIQKWHNAYEESVRVPLVISSPLVNTNSQEIREILQPTSSIDLAPTLLALAGYKEEQLRNKGSAIHGQITANPFPGADLSTYIKGTNTGPIIGPDGNPRTGVLFVGNDMITELGTNNPGVKKKAAYALFHARVDSTIALGYPIDTGTVRQPNNMRAFCTGDWKIIQYVDPEKVKPDNWELYCLTYDPVELINLVDFSTDIVRDDVSVPGMTTEEIQLKNDSLKRELDDALGIPETTPVHKQMKLYQNFPNPFNHQTTVSFYIPETGPVNLAVTDLSGRKLQVVVNQTLPPGIHKYTLDANHLTSGIYFIRLEFNNQRLVEKMMLMK
ncbi:MAG: sulfatase-like hydrolase/transferase [Bacteroidales bacterium]|nr:sulfatase-like hydrolase/transferase [Bacteroidales bacterium]